MTQDGRDEEGAMDALLHDVWTALDAVAAEVDDDTTDEPPGS